MLISDLMVLSALGGGKEGGFLSYCPVFLLCFCFNILIFVIIGICSDLLICRKLRHAAEEDYTGKRTNTRRRNRDKEIDDALGKKIGVRDTGRMWQSIQHSSLLVFL